MAGVLKLCGKTRPVAKAGMKPCAKLHESASYQLTKGGISNTMQDTSRKINVIQSRVNLPFISFGSEYRKRRVAAYARVSTDSDEQLSSYEAQVDFYTRHINSNPEWEFVIVYTDEGISGTNMKKRDGFNRMIADALDGKIDLILTKSISRFARNTVDSLV